PRDVRRVAAPPQPTPHQWVVVTLVGGQVLPARRARSGTLHRDALKRRAHRTRVVAVRPRDLDADGRAALFGQDMPLRAEFAAVHGAFPRSLAAQGGLRRGVIYRLPPSPDAAHLF